MEGNQFSRSFLIELGDADARGQWKPSAMLRAMQELGEGHCETLNLSRDTLLEKGMCWVLYRMRYQIYQGAAIGDAITATTWARKTVGPFFPRCYAWERDGQVIGEAHSTWVLFDVATRHILRPTMLPGTLVANERESALPAPGALGVTCCDPVETRRVRYTELDANGHMNNTRYADWVCDLTDGRPMRDLQINFVAEAHLGEEIALERPEESLIAGVRKGDNQLIFEARAEFMD